VHLDLPARCCGPACQPFATTTPAPPAPSRRRRSTARPAVIKVNGPWSGGASVPSRRRQWLRAFAERCPRPLTPTRPRRAARSCPLAMGVFTRVGARGRWSVAPTYLRFSLDTSSVPRRWAIPRPCEPRFRGPSGAFAHASRSQACLPGTQRGWVTWQSRAGARLPVFSRRLGRGRGGEAPRRRRALGIGVPGWRAPGGPDHPRVDSAGTIATTDAGAHVSGRRYWQAVEPGSSRPRDGLATMGFALPATSPPSSYLPRAAGGVLHGRRRRHDGRRGLETAARLRLPITVTSVRNDAAVAHRDQQEQKGTPARPCARGPILLLGIVRRDGLDRGDEGGPPALVAAQERAGTGADRPWSPPATPPPRSLHWRASGGDKASCFVGALGCRLNVRSTPAAAFGAALHLHLDLLTAWVLTRRTALIIAA
jgi:hypothetical protein